MSFKSYVVNLAKDVVLGLYGVVFGFVGFGLIAMGEFQILGAFFLVTAVLSILYSRYRKQRLGITY